MQVSLENGTTYAITMDKDTLQLDGMPFEWDIQAESAVRFHALRNHRSLRLELVRADWNTKTFEVKINGHIHQLTIKDRFDLLLEKLGMEGATAAKADDLKAPMPGQVLDVLVAPGQEVSEGDKLLVLEAMKMENVLKAGADGIIQAVQVEKGSNVQKNDVMITFE